MNQFGFTDMLNFQETEPSADAQFMIDDINWWEDVINMRWPK